MLVLASSSLSRARLLKEAGISFRQEIINYDESKVSKDLEPLIFVQRVLLEKEKQFDEKFANFKENVLFADSIVNMNGKIYGKAKDKNEALKMLNLQSEKNLCILSAFIFRSKEFKLMSVSSTFLKFKEFDKEKLKAYIENEGFLGKAGAVECEGFHKEFITEMKGEPSTALGLDIKTLKAYL